MIILFRNYFRSHMVNLTAISVRHFIPDCTVMCVSLYKHTENEYSKLEPLLPFINNYFRKTKYVNDTGKPQDHVDSEKTAGYAHPDNASYFSEGYNLAYEIVKDIDDKVLLLSEDHFFTTGKVLKELQENDFSLAYAPWDHPFAATEQKDANASILCFNPKKVSSCFPISEEGGQIVELRIADALTSKIPDNELYKIKNRKQLNYFGDGMYTNSSQDIRNALVEAGIL